MALPSYFLYFSPVSFAARLTRDKSKWMKSSFGRWFMKLSKLCVLFINELTWLSTVSSRHESEKNSRSKAALHTSRIRSNSVMVRQSKIFYWAPRLGSSGKINVCLLASTLLGLSRLLITSCLAALWTALRPCLISFACRSTFECGWSPSNYQMRCLVAL
jgi:hypothetical protein